MEEDDEFLALELTPADQMALRKFLESRQGKNIISLLYSRSPCGNGGMSIDEMALQGSQYLGYRKAIEELQNMARERTNSK
jgi:hypothetical protein